jgi:hypothetical protein
MKLFIILASLSIILIIIIIIYKSFYFSKLNGKKLNNKIIWDSNKNEYNPSIINNIIAIRRCNIEKNNLILSYIKNNIFQKQKKRMINDIIIYTNKARINLNISLEDPRIFYHNNIYYIIAIDSNSFYDYKNDKRNFIPKLIKLDNNFNLINILPFDMNEFKLPITQKNWNLFKDRYDNILMITDVYPKMIIKKVNLENANILSKIEHDTSNFFPEIYKKCFIRCSTNFIPWKNNQLICILHLKKYYIYYRSFFFIIENTYPYRPIKYSKLYHFFNERIEFASGIQWRNNKIAVALGVNDYKGYVTEIDPNDIEFV